MVKDGPSVLDFFTEKTLDRQLFLISDVYRSKSDWICVCVVFYLTELETIHEMPIYVGRFSLFWGTLRSKGNAMSFNCAIA